MIYVLYTLILLESTCVVMIGVIAIRRKGIDAALLWTLVFILGGLCIADIIRMTQLS